MGIIELSGAQLGDQLAPSPLGANAGAYTGVILAHIRRAGNNA
jgi:hypothetical protein